MGAVKNQPGLGVPDRMSARYGGVPVIYLESEEDIYVFAECWFRDRLAHVEFKAASDKASHPGCGGVIEAVQEERTAGNPAWGIVDRDTVMGNNLWALVNETDDATYLSANPFGAEVKTLCRWEMESYLAEGEALEKCRAELKLQPERAVSDVYDELLEHCQALVPHAAANALLHFHRMQGLGDGYTKRRTRHDVDSDIRANQLPRIPHATTVADYTSRVAGVDAFDSPGFNSQQRVQGLLRRVHGKALLERFTATHDIGRAKQLKGLLANRIRELGMIPDELTQFLEHVEAQSA